MTQLVNQKIIELNTRGILPGPNETKEEYLKRADYNLTLRKQLTDELLRDIPFSKESEEASDCLQESFAKTKELYDIAPDWAPLFFSDYQLSLWQGGCAWIFQITNESPTTALIQLRKHFRESNIYLKLYSRNELLAHELSHVGRLAYDESKFEEYFAYRSSKSKFRRWLGPIVKSSAESLLFVIILIMILVLDISALTLGSAAFFPYVLWAKLIPAGLFTGALFRLAWRHRQFNRCLEKIEKITRSKKKANAVMYRLTDLEIIAFSRLKLPAINTYIANQTSLRWQVINAAYLS